MANLKKDEGGGNKSSFMETFENFLNSIPFLKKKESLWDDGSEDPGVDINDAKGHLIYIIMSIYGLVSGFIACQYCKFLHQRFACLAWGIELTSRPIKAYGVPNLVADFITTFLVYAFVLTIGMLLNRVLKLIFQDKMPQCKEVCNVALMYGLLFMTVVSIILLFIPFNIFLVGID